MDTIIASASDSEPPQLYIHHLGIAQEILGPGKRLVIWTSGCPMNCPGCIEQRLQDLNAGSPWEVRELFQQIQPSLKELGRITFSGGEPFFQAGALAELLKLCKPISEVMVFSGYEWDYLCQHYADILAFADILVSGGFEQNRQGSFLWRGSENQQILSPSGKYDDQTLQKWMNSSSAGIELFFEGEQAFTYGIPARGVWEKLNKLLKNHHIKMENNS